MDIEDDYGKQEGSQRNEGTPDIDDWKVKGSIDSEDGGSEREGFPDIDDDNMEQMCSPGIGGGTGNGYSPGIEGGKDDGDGTGRMGRSKEYEVTKSRRKTPTVERIALLTSPCMGQTVEQTYFCQLMMKN